MKNFSKCILGALAVLAIICFAVSENKAEVATEYGITTSMATAGAVSFGDRQRAIFRKLNKDFGSRGVPSPGYLRVEQTIANNKAKYEFNVKSIGSEVATERKLDRNDLFVVTDLAVYLLNQTDAKIGGDVLQTYPNETEFAAAAGFTPGHLETIYNGFLSLKIASKVNIENMSMHSFRCVPETQKSAAANKSQYSVMAAAYPLGSFINLHGTMDISVVIEFPSFVGIEAAAVAAGRTNKIVFHPYGYLIKGGADNK